jgi:hypothetical protein
MTGNTADASGNGVVALAMVLFNAVVLKNAYLIHGNWYWMLLLTIPAMVYALIGLYRSRF